MPLEPLDVLVIAPHPDDAEISVGGTIARCLNEGMRVGIIDLTNGEPTPNGSVTLRTQETQAASSVLGLSWRENLGLPNRQLQHTLEARQALANIFRLTRPRILIGPFAEDAHPDHVVASELIDAARFWSKLTRTDEPGQLHLDHDPFWPPQLYSYWSIHLRIHPGPAFVLDISEQIESKMEAVRCFHSQMIAGRPQDHPTLLDDIRDRARYWGWSIGKKYGEPFSSREEIGINSLSVLQ